jgi:hypothetical protein
VANDGRIELAIRQAAGELADGLAGTLRGQGIHPPPVIPILDDRDSDKQDGESHDGNQDRLAHGFLLSRLGSPDARSDLSQRPEQFAAAHGSATLAKSSKEDLSCQTVDAKAGGVRARGS